MLCLVGEPAHDTETAGRQCSRHDALPLVEDLQKSQVYRWHDMTSDKTHSFAREFFDPPMRVLEQLIRGRVGGQSLVVETLLVRHQSHEVGCEQPLLGIRAP